MFPIDPVRALVACGPLAIYLLVLAFVNLLRRPIVTTGSRDTAFLASALVGFVLVGPMELFTPQQAIARYGPYVWHMLIGLYVLCVVLVTLVSRPRLIVYNVSIEQLRPILADVVNELDQQARWAGDSLHLPELGVSLNLEQFAPLRNVTLRSTGPVQNVQGWQLLDRALSRAVRSTVTARNPFGYTFLIVGLAILGTALYRAAKSPELVKSVNAFIERAL